MDYFNLLSTTSLWIIRGGGQLMGQSKVRKLVLGLDWERESWTVQWCWIAKRSGKSRVHLKVNSFNNLWHCINCSIVQILLTQPKKIHLNKDVCKVHWNIFWYIVISVGKFSLSLIAETAHNPVGSYLLYVKCTVHTTHRASPTTSWPSPSGPACRRLGGSHWDTHARRDKLSVLANITYTNQEI